MKVKIHLIVYAIIVGILASCSSDKFSGFEEGENGFHYKVHYRGTGEPNSHDSDWMMVHMNYRLSDSVLFSSKQLNEDFVFPMIKPMFKGDIYEGIKIMAEGDSMTFAIVADSFFLVTANLKQLPDFVEPGEPMYFDIKLLKRYTNDEYRAKLEHKKDESRNKELLALNKYLSDNKINTKPSPSGLIFIPMTEGYGKKPDTGEMCQVFLEVKVLDGDMLYSNFGNDPIDVEYGKDFDTKGFMEGLGLLKVGGKAKIIVPSEIGVGEIGKETVPGFTTIIYEVELKKIRSVAEVQRERAEKKKAREAELKRLKEIEPQRISRYLSDNKIIQQPTSSGLYAISLLEGTGDKPVNGDVVKVHYSLFSITGKKIESSYDSGEPIEIVIGQRQVIKGWEEGLLLMNEGSKMRFVVPSSLAYGRGTKGEIHPYSPLIFEIELLEILNR